MILRTCQMLLVAAALSASLALAEGPTTRFVSPADAAIAEAEAAVKAAGSTQAYVGLATGFMLKARESADGGYYLRAEAAANKALQLSPDDYDARRVLAWVYTGQHRFPEAAALARREIARRPDDPWNYGTLADALIELGDYDAAEQAVQTMVDLKPGPSAYTRVAYLRELYGDVDGAAEMLEKAAEATTPRDPEHYAWARSQLGILLFNAGKLDAAEGQFAEAMRVFPEYHYALTGMGDVRAAQGRSDEVVKLYRRSLEVAPVQKTAAALGDLLARLGRRDEANQAFALVTTIELINRSNGVRPDPWMALYLVDHGGDAAAALRLAEARDKEADTVRAADALAWARHKNGDDSGALAASERALRLGTRLAPYYFHNGMIHARPRRPSGGRKVLAAGAGDQPVLRRRRRRDGPRHAGEATDDQAGGGRGMRSLPFRVATARRAVGPASDETRPTARRAVASRIALCLALTFVWLAPAAVAHPMGNFTISHASSLRAERDRLVLRYRLDIAEIPSVAEMRELDADGDKTVSEAEKAAYLKDEVPKLTRGLHLKIDGEARPLDVTGSDLTPRPGAGGLPTLLITINYELPVEASASPHTVEYEDANYAGLTGWREVVVTAGDGVMLADSAAPATSDSDGLMTYPTDELAAPPQVTAASFTFTTSGEAVAAAPTDRPRAGRRHWQAARPLRRTHFS